MSNTNEKLTMLKEMNESISESIDNAEKVVKQQDIFILIVTNAIESENKFSEDEINSMKDFVNEMNAQQENINCQIKKLRYRQNMIEFTIKEVEADKDNMTLMNSIFEIFGIFEK